MINKELYIGTSTPKSNEVVWIRPLKDGGVALYAYVYNKWQVLKLVNGKGTLPVDDDEVIDPATPGGNYYTKGEIDEKFADILGLDAEGIAELKALVEDGDALTGLLGELNKKADRTDLENVAYTNVANRFTDANYFRHGDADTAVLINNGGILVHLASNQNSQWCHVEKDSIAFRDTAIGNIAFKPILNNNVVRLAGGVNSTDYKPLAYLEDLNGKQDTLVSGTNIKTVNSNSILGSGDISVGTITGITMNGASKGTSGAVDLGTVLTTTTPNVTSGSTTPITSGGVYTALQNYEKKLTFTTSSNSIYSTTANCYYRHTQALNSASITMPGSKSAGDMVVINFAAGSSPSITISGYGTTVKYHSDYEITASKINEIVCVYNGQYWLVTNTVFE